MTHPTKRLKDAVVKAAVEWREARVMHFMGPHTEEVQQLYKTACVQLDRTVQRLKGARNAK